MREGKIEKFKELRQLLAEQGIDEPDILKALKKQEKLAKQVKKAKILQAQLPELGIDNPSLMETLIYQALLDIKGGLSYIMGGLGFAIALLIAIAVAVF